MKTESKNNVNTNALLSDIEIQNQYVEKLNLKGDQSFSLIIAEAFVRGMRDNGYRSTATAIDDLIDNAVQARATRIDVLCDTETSDKKSYISKIAIIDNGHGMIPDMIRAAILWGGTHRENDRTGFGRYGFGLPSACVSITQEYEVISKVKGGVWYKVKINLDEISKGKLTNEYGLVVAPKAITTELPKFITEYFKSNKISFNQGTIILLNNPDRLTSGYVNPNSFHKKILEHIGTIYRWTLKGCKMFVNGTEVKNVDPLFLDPSALFHTIDGLPSAEAYEPRVVEVKTKEGAIGKIRFRFSYMHPKFQEGLNGKKNNERFPIMAENNHSYFIVTRAGRQIDLVKTTAYQKPSHNIVIVNYDKNWAIELDFDPILDEEFGITTNKQQVTISERLWSIFEGEEIPGIVKSFRKRFNNDTGAGDAKDRINKNEQTTSENIMAQADKYITKSPVINSEKEEKANNKVKIEAEQKSKESGKPKEEHEKEIFEKLNQKPYKLEFEELEGAPFFRVDRSGPQKQLFINTRHRFYSDIYNSADSTPKLKSGLELLLFVIGDCELGSDDEKEIFYKSEKYEWSRRLEVALMLLDKIDSTIDAKSAKEELLEANS